jgi:carboxypeptidase T
MNKLLLISTFLYLSFTNVFATELIRSYEVVANPMRMNQIADRFEVVKKNKGSYEVYVKEQDLIAFLKIAPRAKLLSTNIHSIFQSDDKAVKLNLSLYRTFSDVERDLNLIVKNYKEIASLETYGTTIEGRKLYALKISSPKKFFKANKPEVMVTAATHGDELITVEVLFSLINELLQGYGKDSRLTKIIESRDLYFIPVVSPDSFEGRERYVQGLDPNRSFPWPENPTNKSVDCIQGLMDFTNAHHFVGSLDLHAYGKLVMYPWGYTKTPPNSKDNVIFNDLVQAMARDNQYTAGQISTTIYVAKGSSADYFYWKKETQAIAVELANQKVPPFSTIPKIVTQAREMMWTFLEHFN